MTAASFDHIVRKLRLDDIVKEIEHLPTLPEVVMDLLRTIDQEDLDLHLIAKKVAHDQALTAKTLRFANSSFYGAQSKVTSIQQAISLLGVNVVRNLVTAAAVSNAFPEKPCEGFDFKAFWRHSMATAVCARVMARQLHLNQDFAFTAGLLHDIGKLVLVTCFPQHYERAIAYRDMHDCYLLDAERSEMGIDHVNAGHALAAHWNFAEVIQHAIAGHHAPEAMGGSSVASLLNVADAIAHALDLGSGDNDIVPSVSLVAWHGVGLDAEAYLHIFRQTELEFGEIGRVL